MAGKPRIAVAHPFCWPFVRRGAERILHELSTYLARRGADVTVISSGPRGAETPPEGDYKVELYPQPDWTKHVGRYLTDTQWFIKHCLTAFRKPRFDVVHCLSYYDGFAAAVRKRSLGCPVILHLLGIPVRRYFRRMPHEYLMFRYALRHADEVVTVSRFAQESLRRDFGRESEMITVPVDLNQFQFEPTLSKDRVRILMVGDVEEPRKGASLLCRAFPKIKTVHPDAVLQLSGRISDATAKTLRESLPESMRNSFEPLGVGLVGDLPRHYREASVTVLPSIWEALGMVLLESLACGTPVVGSTHGGIPDVIRSPDVGRMFEPGSLHGQADNVDGLVQAILETIELSKAPGTRQTCRRFAEQFSWEQIGPRYERLAGLEPLQKGEP